MRGLAIAAVVILVSLAGWLVHRRRSSPSSVARQDAEFWRKLLDPVLAVPEGPDRDAVISKLCGTRHHHPHLGELVIEHAEVRRRLGQGLSRPQKNAPPPAPPRPRTRSGDSQEQLDEDLFWFRVFGPIRKMVARERDEAFRDLAVRPQAHPARGKQILDRATLHREFERTRHLTGDKLRARQQALDYVARKGASPAAAVEPRVSPAPVASAVATADSSPTVAKVVPPKTAPPSAHAASSGRDESPHSIVEEMFWFHLLSPLRDLPPRQQQDRLRDMSGKAHRHPNEGNRLFSQSVLAGEFAWVRCADLEKLQARWSAATQSVIEDLEAQAAPEAHANGSTFAPTLDEGEALADDLPLDEHLDALLGGPRASTTDSTGTSRNRD